MNTTRRDVDPLVARLRRRSDELDRLAEILTPPVGCNDAQLIRRFDDVRSLARRLELAAFVVEHDALVEQVLVRLGLMTEAYAQITTGRLVGERERDLADSLIARALHLRQDLLTHWPTLRVAAVRIEAQADEVVAG